jgi:steroid delta-isomerase
MTREELEQHVTAYYDTVRTLDTDAWVGSFAEDGVVQDPVGAPEVRGHDKLRSFFEAVKSSFRGIDLQEHLVVPIPPRAAVKWIAHGETHQGLKADFEGISVFVFAEDGRIRDMRVYWDEQDVQRQFALAEVPARR